MRRLILVLLPLLSIFLQSTLFSFYSIKGVLPDVLLIFVVFFALLNRGPHVTAYGFLCGLLEDYYVGNMIGMNAIAKGFTAFVISHIQGQVFKENLIVGVLGVTIGTFLNTAAIIIINILLSKGIIFSLTFLIAIGVQFFYNIILSVPAYIIYFNSNQYGWLKLIRRH